MEDILKNIETEILEYYNAFFEDNTDDYNENKRIKNKLKDYILNNFSDNKKVREALYLLANHTGCAEDSEIAEEILDYLFENKIITQNEIDFFYSNSNLKRWE
ncbi:hypothetical protein FLACOL_00238 [Flavobacterium columnare]|uniref:Uncharacterized protein n=2 Tax=Flavobacterium TaxID=237 RepID=A0ABW8PRD3_9FLAO|nr:hypothetical protein [Flavobacterium columnare]SPE76260.1 hypothetical protein FLACOL_00238 [Flavobacterium columnare]